MIEAQPSPTSGLAGSTKGTLGTFAGVFTPSVLTILGIILFLRMGYVVGAAGLTRALIMVLLANTISILTSLSLSAIATNLRVKGGGDYYLISRTLGVEYGGAIGLVLFLAQAVSIAFYAIGFGEATAGIAGAAHPLVPQVVAAVAVTLLFVLAWLGADWATKFQYVVMAVLVAALAAFFAGGFEAASGEQLRANLTPASEIPFWVLFAIFFPAVTGFTQGVSMSGDLRDPGRSLPRGTFAAVFVSFAVYLCAAVVFAAVLPGSELVSDYAAMRTVSAVAWLIDAGVIAATLSSAMASFLGAPRILQSLAADRVFPRLGFFAAGHGPTNNPRRGVVFAAIIAYVTIALGNLNAVATIVSMFFLISYGLLNYATFFEAQANSPSFRPRFRFFDARLSLAGAAACLAVMLAISPMAGAIASVALFMLFQYVSRTVRVERWADSSRSHRLQRVRDDLHAVRAELEHPRDWRPMLLVFSNNPSRRERLLYFASWLEGGAGFTTMVRLQKGEGAFARRERQLAEEELASEIKKHGLDAFAKVIMADDVERAVPVLLQSYGLGQVRPNTVLLNWYDRGDTEESPGLVAYSAYLRMALRFDCNVLLLAARSMDFEAIESMRPQDRRIDVWYEDNASGRLMLLLAYLMTRSDRFEDAPIRLLAAAESGETADVASQRLSRMLEEVRIEAQPVVVSDPGPDTVIARSQGATVVFQSFRLQGAEPRNMFGGPVDEVVKNLGCTVLVLASQDIELDSEPEAGRHAEIAGAADAAEKATKLAGKADAEAEEAASEASETRRRVSSAVASGVEPETLAELEEAASKAEDRAEKSRRRVARLRAKAEAAVTEAEEHRGEVSGEAE
ncbi:MAG: amino acid permease [Thermoanaerobaculia bacterium]